MDKQTFTTKLCNFFFYIRSSNSDYYYINLIDNEKQV